MHDGFDVVERRSGWKLSPEEWSCRIVADTIDTPVSATQFLSNLFKAGGLVKDLHEYLATLSEVPSHRQSRLRGCAAE